MWDLRQSKPASVIGEYCAVVGRLLLTSCIQPMNTSFSLWQLSEQHLTLFMNILYGYCFNNLHISQSVADFSVSDNNLDILIIWWHGGTMNSKLLVDW